MDCGSRTLVAVCLYVALTSIVYSAPVPIVLWSLNARTLATSCENGVASILIALVAADPYVASTSIELLRHSVPIPFRSIDARCDATPIADQLSIIDIVCSIRADWFRKVRSSFNFVRPRVNGCQVRRINASRAKRADRHPAQQPVSAFIAEELLPAAVGA